jgi:RHS repeat-associated protein
VGQLIDQAGSVESQTTTYVYGTAVQNSDPEIYSNDLVRAVIYPDSTDSFDAASNTLTGSDNVSYEYDRQGEMVQMTDQARTTHQYTYDGVGRLLSDSVTSFGTGVDTSVASIDYTYKVCGKLLTVSSENSSGTVLNQVEYGYDSDGILTTEYQEHAGAVDTATSLYVAYGHAADKSLGYRPTSLQYPTSGSAPSRVLTYDYGDSIDPYGNLGRVGSIVDGSGTTSGTTADITLGITLATYSYLGLDTLAGEDYTEPQIDLDYTGTTPGSYPGLDQYGEIVDQVWKDYGTSQTLDEYKYGYDAEGNVTYRQNVVSANQSTPVYLDEAYTYDGLGQLQSLTRGQLNTTTDQIISSTENFTQGWTLDGMGTWAGFQEGNGTSATLNQTRTASEANEIQGISNATGQAAWAQPEYDLAGNMTTSPLPAGEGQGEGRQGTCTYDAWNRLVSVTDGTTTVSYAYDGLGRLIERITDAGVTHYYYAGDQLIETRHAAALPNRTAGTNLPENLSPHYQYVWSAVDPNAPILRDDLSTGSTAPRLYYLTDANDNVTALVAYDQTAGDWQVKERYVYDAYGNVTVYNATWSTSLGGYAASAVGNTVLFGGLQVAPLTGLYRAAARWYDASTGDWLSRDPAQSDANLYRYVDDDPTSLQDPSGLAVGGGGPWAAPAQPGAPQQPGPGSGPCNPGPGSRGAPTPRPTSRPDILVVGNIILYAGDLPRPTVRDLAGQMVFRDPLWNFRTDTNGFAAFPGDAHGPAPQSSRSQVLELFGEWVRGGGRRVARFGPLDSITNELATGEGAALARRNAVAAIRRNPDAPLELTVYAPGTWQYARDYATTFATLGYVGNTAQSFVGGYEITATVIYVDARDRVARVHFQGYNESTLGSATRIPWSRGHTLLSNDPFGANGPLGTTVQYFDWEETLYVPPPDK